MFQKFIFSILIICSISMYAQNELPKTIHGFTITTLEGESIDLSLFKGKKILIVNTASKCGFTPQYEDLEKLYQTYKDQLVVIGFPANNFMNQEPGTNKDIAEFCERNYGVSFPMSEKISVKGKDIDPIYEWLTKKEFNGVKNNKVKWNFNKFLIDEEGNLIEHFGSSTKPMSSKITGYLN